MTLTDKLMVCDGSVPGVVPAAAGRAARRLLDELALDGRRGMSTADLLGATGIGRANASAILGRLLELGAVEWRKDQLYAGKGQASARRWYLAGCAPKEKPLPTGPIVPPRTWTSWEGFASRAAPSVVSAAECRPWAAAAAESRAC